MQVLIVRKGLQKGTALPLDPARKRYSLGSEASSSLVLEDEGVSRRHAEFLFDGRGWVLRDLDSRNGTFVNSLPAREQPLASGDVITMGLAEIVVAESTRPAEGAEAAEVDSGGTAPVTFVAARILAGGSDEMRRVNEALRRAAPLTATLLIRGETGTGKELAARAVHTMSPRRDGPFVAVNCGAIPEALVESELFGHEKGAFTGAAAPRRGRFEEASGGTLLLDEIGDLPGAAQAKLLRVLQEKSVRPLGAAEDRRVDARVVAATHRDLEDAVKSGSFREDLYHRLNVLEVRMPPLRERISDIPALVDLFLDEIAASSKPGRVTIADEAVLLLQSRAWPGNVRELRNILERAVLRARTNELTSADLASAGAVPEDGEAGGLMPPLRPGETLEARLRGTESALVRATLAAAGWNRSEAARRLGISEGKIRKCIVRYGIERP